LKIEAQTEKDRKKYINAMHFADKYDFSKLQEMLYNNLQEALKRNL
jgi:hypothetical protein